MSRPSAAKTARRARRKGRTTITLGVESKAMIIEQVSHGYIRPRWRNRTLRGILAGSGVRRPWLRYHIMRLTLTTVTEPVERGWSRSKVVGYAWTRRGADKAVAALRRAEP